MNEFVKIVDPEGQLFGIGLSMNAAAQLHHSLAVVWGHLSGVRGFGILSLFQLTNGPGVIVGGVHELLRKLLPIIVFRLFEFLQDLLELLFGNSHILNGGHGRSQGEIAAFSGLAENTAETRETCWRTSRTSRNISSARAVFSAINCSMSS